MAERELVQGIEQPEVPLALERLHRLLHALALGRAQPVVDPGLHRTEDQLDGLGGHQLVQTLAQHLGVASAWLRLLLAQPAQLLGQPADVLAMEGTLGPYVLRAERSGLAAIGKLVDRPGATRPQPGVLLVERADLLRQVGDRGLGGAPAGWRTFREGTVGAGGNSSRRPG